MISGLASLVSDAVSGSGRQQAEEAVREARHLVGAVLERRLRAGIDRDRASSWPLDETETRQVLEAACAGLPDRAAYLVLGQRLGIFAIGRDTAEYIEELFEVVADEAAAQVARAAEPEPAASRGVSPPRDGSAGGGLWGWLWGAGSSAEPAGGEGAEPAAAASAASAERECVMTVPLLAALCEELGLGFLEGEAREALTVSAAVRTGRVRLQPADWLVIEPPSVMAQHRKRHGEQSAAELAMLAEEVARAAAEAGGVDAAPGTDWAAVRRAADARARRELAGVRPDGPGGPGVGAAEAAPAYREFTPGGPDVGAEAIRQQRLRSRLAVRSHLRVPLRRSEFVDFLANVGAGMGEAELRRYVEVFLFLSGLRGAAGVQAPGVATAEAATAALDR